MILNLILQVFLNSCQEEKEKRKYIPQTQIQA